MKVQTKIMAEMAVSIGLAYALSFIVPFRLPQGGSVTAVSMVPILWFALRRGPKMGVVEGGIYGLVRTLREPFIVHPVQFLLDYPLGFAALGLAGLLKKHPIGGVAIGIGGRFVCHFLSGVVFFAMYAPAGMNPAVYSAIYNGSYLIVELILSMIVMFMLVRRGIVEMYL